LNFNYYIALVFLTLLLYFILIINTNPSISFATIESNSNHNMTKIISCKCVIFRIDDIQDYWINQGQIKVMDLFISKNQSFSLGLIMNGIGNDSEIIDKVKEGYKKGLFELALHGWNHENFSKLNEQNQQLLLQNANKKMETLFGKASNIFIPPFDAFDNGTLQAMSKLGIPIFSSFKYYENNTNNGHDIFVADGKTYNNNSINNTIYHIPGTIGYKEYLNNSWFKTPLGVINNTVFSNIEKYGYAVILLHPQDFMKVDEKGNISNVVDENEISDLSFLINYMLSKNISIVPFSKVLQYGPTKTTHL
jgi:hypothetical protein